MRVCVRVCVSCRSVLQASTPTPQIPVAHGSTRHTLAPYFCSALRTTKLPGDTLPHIRDTIRITSVLTRPLRGQPRRLTSAPPICLSPWSFLLPLSSSTVLPCLFETKQSLQQ